MIKTISFGFLIVSALVILSCKEPTTNTFYKKVETLAQKKFVLVDSIIVKGVSTLYLVITDFNSVTKKYLAFDPLGSNEIFEFDIHGNITRKLNLMGTDSLSYGNYLYGLGYISDSSICIVSEKGCSIYDFNSHRINFVHASFAGNNINYQMSIDSRGIIYCPVILAKQQSSDINPSNRGYSSNKKNIMAINFKDSTYTPNIKFEENSIYLNDKIWYNKNYATSIYDMSDSSIKIIYQLENKVYEYKSSNDGSLSLKKIVNLSPEYFGEIRGLKYGKGLDQFKLIEADAENSSYTHLSCFNDTLYTVYAKGVMPTDLESISVNGKIKVNQIYEQKYQEYVGVYCNDQQVCGDLKVPENCAGVSFIQSSNFLMPKRKSNEDIRQNNQEIIYVYEIK